MWKRTRILTADKKKTGSVLVFVDLYSKLEQLFIFYWQTLENY